MLFFRLRTTLISMKIREKKMATFQLSLGYPE